MWRNFLLELAVMALPFILYYGYRNFLLRHKREDGADFSPIPYHRLFAIGLGLALIVFVIAALTGDRVREGKYVPAHMENGKLVPGEVVPHKPAQSEKNEAAQEPATKQQD